MPDLIADRRDLLTPLATVTANSAHQVVIRWRRHYLILSCAAAADLIAWLPPVPCAASLDVLSARVPTRLRVRRGLRWLRT